MYKHCRLESPLNGRENFWIGGTTKVSFQTRRMTLNGRASSNNARRKRKMNFVGEPAPRGNTISQRRSTRK